MDFLQIQELIQGKESKLAVLDFSPGHKSFTAFLDDKTTQRRTVVTVTAPVLRGRAYHVQVNELAGFDPKKNMWGTESYRYTVSERLESKRGEARLRRYLDTLKGKARSTYPVAPLYPHEAISYYFA